MKYLHFLYLELLNEGDTYKSEVKAYADFILLNANSLIKNYPDATYGQNWNQTSTIIDAVTQIAGCSAIIAAAAVAANPPGGSA